MPPKILEGISGKLADRWFVTLLTPAFVFWAGGIFVFCERYGIDSITKWLGQYSELLQVAILTLSLGCVVASGFVVQRFDSDALRILEGYWYPGLQKLLYPLMQWQSYRRQRLLQRLKVLNPKLMNQSATPFEKAEFVKCDRSLRRLPTQDRDLLPTLLGNTLRASERHPQIRYGLDAVVCWPRLWLLLPASVKQELQGAHVELTHAIRLCVWSLLLTIWSIWVIWVAPIGILAFLIAYKWAVEAAEVYADLLEATFDLYRYTLYEALRWQLPNDSNEEIRVGKQLSDYLWRGIVA